MKKKLTLTINEDVIRDLKIYVLNHDSNNVSKLIEELATEFLNKEGEKQMKKNQNLFYSKGGTKYTSDTKNDVYPSDDGEFVHVAAQKEDKDYILTFKANPDYNPDDQSQDEWSDWVVITAEEI